jgi:hypothetical protein
MDAKEMPAAAAKPSDRRLESPPGRRGKQQHIGTSSRCTAPQHAGYNRALGALRLV